MSKANITLLFITSALLHLLFDSLVFGQFTIPTASSSFRTVASAGDNYALIYPAGVRISNYSRIIIADTKNHQLKFIHSNGSLLTLCGTGEPGFAGSPFVNGKFKARYAKLNEPRMISMSTIENTLFIAEAGNNIIRKFNMLTGELVIVAGNLTAGFYGDKQVSTNAMLNGPRGVTFDTNTQNHLYIADTLNHVIRKVDLITGLIDTISGIGGTSGFTDGVLAISAKLNGPQAVSIASNGDIYIADTGNNRIRKITKANGIISTICGTGSGGIAGDGSAAISAMINSPRDIYLGLQNDLYIADSWNHRLRRIDFSTNIIQTVSGTTSMSGVESVSVNILSKPGVSSMVIAVADTNNQRIQVFEYSCNNTLYTINMNGSLCLDKPVNYTFPDWKETDLGDYWMNEEPTPPETCPDNYLGEKCEFKFCFGSIVSSNFTCSNSSSLTGYVEKLTIVRNGSELDSKLFSFENYGTSFEFPSSISDKLNQKNATEIILISSIYDPKSNSAPISFSNSDKLKSTIMSISLYDRQLAKEFEVSNLQDPISLRFYNISIGSSEHLNYSCAYYDNSKKNWTFSGLKTTILYFVNKTIDESNYEVIISVQCETNHLTSFGIIESNVKKAIIQNDKPQSSTVLQASDQSAIVIGIVVGIAGVLLVVVILSVIAVFAVVLLLRSRRKQQENRKKLQEKLQQQLALPSTSTSV